MKRYLQQLLEQYFSFYLLPGSKIIRIDRDHPDFKAKPHSAPDYIVLNGIVHSATDLQELFEKTRSYCAPETRVIIAYYSSLWKPLIGFANWLGIREDQGEENWVAPSDIQNFLNLADFELLSRSQHILIPLPIPFISNFINRWLAPLPFFQSMSLVNIAIAKPMHHGNNTTNTADMPSVSVIVAARNEAGNMEALFQRLPQMGSHTELILIEGGSSDHTWDEMHKMKAKYDGKIDCLIARQDGKGKGDAVRKGFAMAKNDILMILDADLTVPPEELPKFYQAIVRGKGEFINGSRLVYPQESEAMRFFNMVGNKFFAMAFSFLLGQNFKDTLCGTKVMYRKQYERLAANRSYFGEFDPFGDFDLLFGAARLGLKIVELPIRCKNRTYGETNIQRWRHGMILLRMTVFAARRIKFI
jgi:hypothetical protein